MDKHDFLRIAVTVPYVYGGEAGDIARILRSGGTDLVHIRKPDATPEAVSELVSAIPAELRPRLTLHDCLDLAPALGVGGVTEERCDALRELGFDGAAMLTAAWRPKIDAASFRLQFITNPTSVDEALAQAKAALEGGCRWIQLRWKDAPADGLVGAAHACADACRRHGAMFVIDDHVELVGQCGADGVHLGKNDMPPSEARRILGPCRIIGATANTPADIDNAVAQGADYIGYGPFRFTSTKKNLSPVLGLDGYRVATAHCRETGIGLPIVAIGGITADDIPAIMDTGVSGIAVSGVIALASDPVAATRRLLDRIDNR